MLPSNSLFYLISTHLPLYLQALIYFFYCDQPGSDDRLNNIQIPTQATRHREDARRPERQRLAPLTSLTVPPLPHTQSHGAHFQTLPGWRRSSQNGT